MQNGLKFIFLSIIFVFCRSDLAFCPENVASKTTSEQASIKNSSKAKAFKKQLIKSIKKGFELGLAFGLGAAFCAVSMQALNHARTEFDPNSTSTIAHIKDLICLSKANGKARLAMLLERRNKYLEDLLRRNPDGANKIDEVLFCSTETTRSINNEGHRDYKSTDLKEIKDIYDGFEKDENHGRCHCSSPLGHVTGTFICSLFYAAAIAGVVTVSFGAATLVQHYSKELYQKIQEIFRKSRSDRKLAMLCNVEKIESQKG